LDTPAPHPRQTGRLQPAPPKPRTVRAAKGQRAQNDIYNQIVKVQQQYEMVPMTALDLFPSRDLGPFGRRQKRARGARMPVTIVTGFLGAGKTTLVRRFLTTPEGRATAVIINEYGAVGIDDALVRGTTDEVALLGNGCVCCITRSDLQVTLRRLLIETSGLADPGPILQTFATDRALGAEFFVEVVLTAVDAVSGVSTLEWSAEARKQAILADRIVITKSDLADPDEPARLTAHLRTLNKQAPIEIAVDGVLDPRCLTEPGAAERSGFVAEAEHSDGILSFVMTEEEPLDFNAFARAMETLMALRGGDLLRVKGFLNIAGCRGPVLVQVVQHLSHPPIELASWPDESRVSRLVFITRNVPEQQVRDLFAAVQALAGAGDAAEPGFVRPAARQ
jgi:G3E family GTPase